MTVAAPVEAKYDIVCTYYISRSDVTNAANINAAAQAAVESFIAWQKEKLGRDINPTELYYRLKAAGVKRAEIVSPIFTATGKGEVAIAESVHAVFGGLEDD